ncbi:MAG: hypothetical protein JWM88_1890 [Verrucomicrobia bacterium]|nr:hypothetical protein [Verrucomicrobiota bacterium]
MMHSLPSSFDRRAKSGFGLRFFSLRTLAFIGFSLIGLQTPLLAARHYIRAGAAGTNDGSSWTNAWPTFAAATFVRGDTYFVAGGTYNESRYINVALNGALWIYIKKANDADNLGETGYSSSYATTVATVQSFDFDKGYISIDGVTGSGTSGHGFHILNPSVLDTGHAILLENGAGPFSVSHCNIEGSGFAVGSGGTSGIYYANFTNKKGIYVGYCWIHEVTTNGCIFTQLVGTSFSDYGLLFENNVVSETGGCTDVDKHGQGLQLGQQTEMAFLIFRNNVFRNILGSGMIVFLSSGSGSNHHDIQIYNNLFYITDLSTYRVISPGVIWSESDRGIYTNVHLDNMVIANNTFYGLGSTTANSVSGSVILQSPTANNTLVNNLWENCRMSSPHVGFATESNNAYYQNSLNVPTGTLKQVNGSATTMVNASAFDLHVKTGGYAIGKGKNLPGLFATDFEGKVRGGVWDIGAYQLATTSDAPPTNAQVIAK